jgi:peptidoglycan biosynthesis protein MviN/MurJ (putative lipid II flippase)
MTAAYIVAAVVDVISNVILAPHLLALGALCAAICAEFCSCGLQLWMLMRSEYRFHILADLVPYATGAAAMGVVLVGWQHVTPFGGAMQTVSEMGIGALAYAIVLAVWPGTIINRFVSRA